MDDCPVCLEPLTGTIVTMACCRKQVHIQCYLPRCPMCRADLPSAPAQPTQHVILQMPPGMVVQPRPLTQPQKVFLTALSLGGIATSGFLLSYMINK